jgi:hypothetical protein
MDIGIRIRTLRSRLRQLKRVWKPKKLLCYIYLYNPSLPGRVLTFSIEEVNITSKGSVRKFFYYRIQLLELFKITH